MLGEKYYHIRRKKAPEFVHGDELRSGDFRSSLGFKCDRLKNAIVCRSVEAAANGPRETSFG